MSRWPSQYGHGMSGHAIYLRFRKFTLKLLGRAINPHLLRDCGATTLASNCLRSAMAAPGLLGHRELRTTEKYYIQPARQIEAAAR